MTGLVISDDVYVELRNRIQTRKYIPGQRLQIEIIANELGVSRTPVREAFVRLVENGILRKITSIGYFPEDITAAEIRQIYEIKNMLLQWIIKKSASSIIFDRQFRTTETNKNTNNENKNAPYIDIIGHMLNNISELSINQEMSKMTKSLINRMYYIRFCETMSVQNYETYLNDIINVPDNADINSVIHKIDRMYKIRTASADATINMSKLNIVVPS